MSNKIEVDNCCGIRSEEASYCQIEAIVTVDNRGQIILPKEVRKKANIDTGDKLAVISCEFKGKTYCISLVKSGEFADTVKNVLGPQFQKMSK
jgi:AbrB family looped-hinge helix DNA binding protein